MIAVAMRDVLQDHGFPVAGIASTCAAVLASCRRRPPRLAICDVKLHHECGLDCIRLLPMPLRPKLIVVSAYDRSDCPDAADGLTVVSWLVKPFHERELLEAIGRAYSSGT